MTKKIIFLALGSLLLAPCSAAEAQRPTKVPRIGVLTGSSLPLTRLASRHFGRVCGISDTWRERTLSSNGDFGRKTRSPARNCRRASAAQGRRHRRGRHRRYTRSQGGQRDNSHCDDFGWRCCRKRPGRQPSAPGRKRYRIGNPSPGAKRQTAGASKGGRSRGSHAWPSSRVQAEGTMCRY